MPGERKASVEDRNRLASPKKRDQRKGHDQMLDTSAEDNLNLCPRVTCRSHGLPSEERREMTWGVCSTCSCRVGRGEKGGQTVMEETISPERRLSLWKFGCILFKQLYKRRFHSRRKIMLLVAHVQNLIHWPFWSVEMSRSWGLSFLRSQSTEGNFDTQTIQKLNFCLFS